MTFTARGLYASSSKEPRGRRGRWWLVIGAIVGLAALGTGVLGILTTAVSETTTDTTEFPAPSRREIDNNTEGSVTLVAEDTDTVTVRVDVWSSMMSQPSWDTETEGDTLRLAANCSLIFTVFGRCSVDYEVAVPEGTEVSVHTVTGDVDVTGVSARVDASTDTGEIRLADVTGEITAESATGRITAAGSGPSAVVTSDTGEINLEDFQAADVQATSAIGAIRIGSGFDTARVRSDTGAITVTTDTEFQTLHATTAIGNIELQVPDRVYRVTADTTVGSPKVAVDQSRDATSVIEARSDTGDITITPR